jgi:hypothetical protein
VDCARHAGLTYPLTHRESGAAKWLAIVLPMAAVIAFAYALAVSICAAGR